jgi:aminoglycoside/choline kinase family phosphotransferase
VVSRDDKIRSFVAAHGFGGASITPLAQDASFRRYWRLTDGPSPAVLMDAPPAQEDVRPYLAIGALLAGSGLSVPAVLAADPSAGLVLLEDFGDALFPAALAFQPPDQLYDAAVDALSVLARVPAPAGLRRWGPTEMAVSAGATFLDWWWPAMFGSEAPDPVRVGFLDAMSAMLASLDRQQAVLVHRDYFAGNLFWLPERSAAGRVGLIDFQDAALGSPAYDLVSLVQDARRDLPVDLAARAIARTLDARPELDAAAFEAAFAICAAQRHLRVACLWVRLARRDNKPDYLRHAPRCWAMLERALGHQATAPLAAFLDRHVPQRLRRTPEGVAA